MGRGESVEETWSAGGTKQAITQNTRVIFRQMYRPNQIGKVLPRRFDSVIGNYPLAGPLGLDDLPHVRLGFAAGYYRL